MLDFQFTLLILTFSIAAFYVLRVVYRSFAKQNNSCGSGCGKCGVDFKNIDKKQ